MTFIGLRTLKTSYRLCKILEYVLEAKCKRACLYCSQKSPPPPRPPPQKKKFKKGKKLSKAQDVLIPLACEQRGTREREKRKQRNREPVHRL